MSLNVTFNGVVYIIPETGEVNWGSNLDSYFVAIAAGALQKTGGSFTLSAETDFGASFGLKSLYYKSRNSNVAASGIVRLNNNSDAVSWRNAANSADLPLIVDASNRLTYNGNNVLTGTGPANYVSSITGTVNQITASASTGAVTLSLPQAISTGAAVQFGGLSLGATLVSSAMLSMSSTTLGFLPPRMTTAQRDAISSPATGLQVYNTTTNQYNLYDGTSWMPFSQSAGGTVTAGAQYNLPFYNAAGTTLTASTTINTNANGGLLLGNGTLAAPAYSFSTHTNSGFYSDTSGFINFGILGSFIASFDNTGLLMNTGSRIYNILGTALLPSYTFTGNTNTGIFSSAANTLNLSTNGVSRISLDVTSLTSTLPIYVANGTTTAPSYAFSSNTDLGMYRSAANQLGFTTAGVTRASLDGSYFSTASVTGISNVAGTAALPSYTFNGNTDTGIYGGADIRFATAGVLRARVNGNGLVIDSGQLRAGAGSLSLPSMAFELDDNTGIYNPSANILGFVTNGIEGMRINALGAITLINEIFSSGAFSGAANTVEMRNTSNTASSEAVIRATVGGTSAGDAYVRLGGIGGVGSWVFGLDNSTTNDDWVLSNGTALGTSNAISVDGSSYAVAIRGSNTNNAAAAGFVGEYVSSAVSTNSNYPATGVYGDLTSISLTAGDWLVTGAVRSNTATSSTTTNFEAAVTTTSGNSISGGVQGENYFETNFAAPANNTRLGPLVIASYRISLSATTTVYLKYAASYPSGQPVATGSLRATRVR